MLIYTYEVTTSKRRFPMPYGFTSREEAERFRAGLEEHFSALKPRMVKGPVYYVASAVESLAIFEREENEKP